MPDRCKYSVIFWDQLSGRSPTVNKFVETFSLFWGGGWGVILMGVLKERFQARLIKIFKIKKN